MKYMLLLFVPLLFTFTAQAQQAGDCAVTLEATDNMRFSSKSIAFSASCTEVTLTLIHTGKLPAKAMGHNVVISAKSAMKGLIADSFSAGFDNNFIAPGDTRPIAFSKVIGGGESTTITFSPAAMSADEEYVFFCAAPGHWSMMKGTVNLLR